MERKLRKVEEELEAIKDMLMYIFATNVVVGFGVGWMVFQLLF